MFKFCNKLCRDIEFMAKLISKKLFVIIVAFCLSTNIVGYGLNNNVYSIDNYNLEQFRENSAKDRKDRIDAAYVFDDVLKQNSIMTENLILEKFEAKNVKSRNIEELEADGSGDASVLRTLAHFLVDYDEKQAKELDLSIEKPFNFESAVEFLKSSNGTQKSGNFVIRQKEYMSQPVVGCTSLSLHESADSNRRVVSFGIFLGKHVFKKGIGTEAMTELVDMVINSKDVDECRICAFEENKASLKLFNKVFDIVIGLNPYLKLEKICETIHPFEGVNIRQIRLIKSK